MAFSIFLNFEKLALEIVEKEIAQMTNDNLCDCGELDEVDDEKFSHNLYHGSIAVVFMANLYETTLNTILRQLNCTEKEVLKTSHEVKLQLICAMFQTDISEIKGDNSYSYLRSIERLRNDITHYKSNMVTEGHYITLDSTIPMGTSKTPLAKQFTKDYMEKCYVEVLKLLELICRKCGLVLYRECAVIDCDGRDEACEFVLTQEMLGNRDTDD